MDFNLSGVGELPRTLTFIGRNLQILPSSCQRRPQLHAPRRRLHTTRLHIFLPLARPCNCPRVFPQHAPASSPAPPRNPGNCKRHGCTTCRAARPPPSSNPSAASASHMLPAGLKVIGSLALLQTAASSSSIAYSALGSRQCWNDGTVPLPSASWQPSDRDARIESAVSSM